MKKFQIPFLHTQFIYYIFGIIKGSWHLYAFDESNFYVQATIVFLGGVVQGLLAIYLYGYLAKFIVNHFEHRQFPILEKRWISCSMIAGTLSLFHMATLQGDSSPFLELIYMFVYLGPIPHFLLRSEDAEIPQSENTDIWWTQK